MDYKEAVSIIGGLSNPSKMPSYAWSIPAVDCVTGSKLRKIPGSTCSACYALSGMYRFPAVKNAMERRLKAWREDPRFVEAFIFVLKTLDERGRLKGVFRFFDSGDLQSVDMLTQFNEIASALPNIKFWLPTRELKLVKEWLKKGNSPVANLFIKISHPMIGGRFNSMPEGLSFTTVDHIDSDIFSCPASTQENKCGTCRTCWSHTNVSYHLH